MAKRIQESVRVTLRRGGTEPARFTWNGRRYTIQRVEAVWKETGAWWDGEGERTFFRVTAGAGAADPCGVYELALEETDATWILIRMLD